MSCGFDAHATMAPTFNLFRRLAESLTVTADN
jgi:hypothetical protein